MKKIILLLIIPFAALLTTSCDTTDDPVTSTEPGNIFITSNPADAEIWLGGNDTFQFTPDTIKNLVEGVYNVTLKLADYYDASFSVNVIAGQTSIHPNVVLVSDIVTTLFGPKKIYETEGTTAQQPSGLDLSSGNAWGVDSDSSSVVDIYYFKVADTLFFVRSADLFTGLIRRTDFFVGNSDNIFDDEDSPEKDSTWTNNINSTESNYVFLYDHDGHYSKFKIVNSGGGVAGEPFWVEVLWYYNNDILDKRF